MLSWDHIKQEEAEQGLKKLPWNSRFQEISLQVIAADAQFPSSVKAERIVFMNVH